jgi:hypothetical protein
MSAFGPLAGGYIADPTFVDDTTVADTGGGGGWLSGISDLFSTVGTVYTNVSRANNPPPRGSVLYNPQTGLPYTQQQLAGTNSIETSELLLILGGAALLLFALKKR